MWARRSKTGVSFYFRYTHGGKKKAVALGAYDENGSNGLTLAQARDKAGELSKIYQSGVTDLHGHLERQREAAERAQRAAEEAARREQEAAQCSTLKQIIDAYVGHLERQGKQATKDVRSILRKHVLEEAPDLAVTKAADVPADEFVRLIGKVVEAGKGRTAGKLRSYLRAAYSLAIRSRTDPDAPLTLRAFGITANPIADIGALSKYNRARGRVLSAPEFVALIKRLETLPPGAQKDALQLCILLGGQRPAQLLRARSVDVDLAASTLTLYDPKGARQQPRQHVVPLTARGKGFRWNRIMPAAHPADRAEPPSEWKFNSCRAVSSNARPMPYSLRTRRHRALVASIIQRRKEAGLTQRDLAARLRVSQSWVASIEAGQRRVDVVEMLDIAQALQVSPEVFLKAAQG